ncbi:MAG TPA: alpha-amylase family glycosyl hydrolase, partial [bacterium]
SYDGKVIKCCTTNLYDKNVRDYHHHLFKYWVDPNADGNFEDGIDGFRIDHIMDDLDWKGKLTGLLANFWKPLFAELRAINPDIVIIGEQAEWGYGEDYFNKGDVNAVFAFPVSQAIQKLKAKDIREKVQTTYKATPVNKYQLIFIENHDMPRIATVLKNDALKLKVSAALNLLLKGVPIIYYGQEIGMTGANGFGKFGSTDGNDIPVREAFEWYQSVEGQGMALWYKNTGPWWDQTQLKNNDGVSLKEQKVDPKSLWNFYKTLIALRKANSAIQTGRFQFLDDKNDQVLSFLRWNDVQAILVLINLNKKKETVSLDISKFPVAPNRSRILELLKFKDGTSLEINEQKISVKLTNYDIQIWQIR